MARDGAGELRGLIKKARRGKRGRFPSELRAQVVEFARGRWSEGATVAQVAEELGVSNHTLAYWRAQEGVQRGKMRRVRVVEEPRAARRTLTLIGPHGVRVEGAVDEIAELLRRLS